MGRDSPITGRVIYAVHNEVNDYCASHNIEVRSSFRSLRLHGDAPDALERSSRLREDDLTGVPLFNEAPEDKHD